MRGRRAASFTGLAWAKAKREKPMAASEPTPSLLRNSLRFMHASFPVVLGAKIACPPPFGKTRGDLAGLGLLRPCLGRRFRSDGGPPGR
ncbi:hypothetical protein TthHC11_06280 [Thermus thermophilus]|nr:hypothetical protein TthHC11_06280 [Thermus thermophilus]